MAATLTAHATVLTFDNLPIGVVPIHYGGLTWTQSAEGWDAVPGYYPYNSHSGKMDADLAEFSHEDDSVIYFPTPSQFQGAWFSGGAGMQLGFNLWLDGKLVATTSMFTVSPTPSFLASGYSGPVGAVSIKSYEFGFFAMDDFTFTAAVPEPSGCALMLAGLAAGAALWRWRDGATGRLSR